jgi:hypothetical protein
VWCAGLLLKWLVAPWLALTPTHLRLPLALTLTSVGREPGAPRGDNGQWTGCLATASCQHGARVSEGPAVQGQGLHRGLLNRNEAQEEVPPAAGERGHVHLGNLQVRLASPGAPGISRCT